MNKHLGLYIYHMDDGLNGVKMHMNMGLFEFLCGKFIELGHFFGLVYVYKVKLTKVIKWAI